VAARTALSTMRRFIAFEYVRLRTTKNVVALIGFTIAKIATNVVTAKVVKSEAIVAAHPWARIRTCRALSAQR